MKPGKRRTILAIVATDRTFRVRAVRGGEAWVGKCLHCNSRLVVGLDGEPLSSATIEHVVPRNHGGGDELENLALACDACNRQKGYRHDNKHPDEPRAREVIEALRARRLERWREPG